MNLIPVKSLTRAPLMLAAVSAVSVAAIACGSGGGATPEATSTQGDNNNVAPLSTGSQQISLPGGSVPVSTESKGASPSSGNAYSIAPVPYMDGSTQQVGIWVTGYGSKDVPADVAEVYLGVESRELTVSAARDAAAEAMTSVLDAIKELGISEDNIETTSFNIYPQQVWDENSREPRITGYIVSNQVKVTVKDLGLLDEVIDTAAEQAGDLIRVNSVSFTVDNPEQHGAETRQMAAADAKAKAELYAQAMGVNLGPLVFLTEIGSSAPLAYPTAARDMAMGESGAGAPTPVEPGDVSLSTTIQAAFAIVP